MDVIGRTAVATFLMLYEAAARGQTSRATVRTTLVWVKVESGSKIVHEHLSPLPGKP